eukprot:TRINITY_DN8812_c0_g1_i2.p1 TRINITY_DN8812_c0_g1~~TRINITY_DN8812_c0_g1_i2.p1  ORF type:complete len:360 (+),score=98.47 TRINITY_DN8812_c0_g1_i2:44-1081(+)
MARAPGNASHVQFIKSVRLRNLLPEKDCGSDLVSIDSEMTLEEASLHLAKHNFLSAPVWNKTIGRFVGLLDIFDLVGFVVFSPILASDHQKDEEEYFRYKAKRWKTDTVGDLLEGQNHVRRKVHLCHEEETLESLMDALSNGGCHRALLFQKGEGTKRFANSTPLKLFTQTNILNFLHHHKTELGHILETRLDQLGLVNPEYSDKNLVKITLKDSALEGFTKVFQNLKAHAVAVINSEDGKLVANLSASDLRGITSETIGSLLSPVEEFLRSRAGRVVGEESIGSEEKIGKLSHPVTCTPRATLGEVMEVAILAKVHRVWVVDSAQRPLRAITLNDLFHALLTPE